MPKKVFETFLRQLLRDIKSNYSVGKKYLSIREIAVKFNVGLQTAQKAVKVLRENNMISVFPRIGITILRTEPMKTFTNKKIIGISNQSENYFNESFLSGIREIADTRKIAVEFIVNDYKNTSSFEFGRYLLNLQADAIITMAIKNAALPFYYAMREGVDIVSDIIIDDLPVLPAIQPDNYLHAKKGGEIMSAMGYRNFLISGYYKPVKNKRLKGFKDGIEKQRGKVQYVCIGDINALTRIDHFFRHFSDDCAVFSADYSTNYILAAKFIQFKIPLKDDNFLVFDSEEEDFHYPGLPPIKSVSPPLRELGKKLCETIIYKWEKGRYPVPLQRKI